MMQPLIYLLIQKVYIQQLPNMHVDLTLNSISGFLLLLFLGRGGGGGHSSVKLPVRNPGCEFCHDEHLCALI